MSRKKRKSSDTCVHIRPMHEKDLPRIVTMENECSLDPFAKNLLRQFIRDEACHNYVAVWREKLLGFVFCMIWEDFVDILDIVVGLNFRRTTVGTQLLQRVFTHLKPPLNKVVVHVPDSNDSLASHLFFQKNKFRASRTFEKRYYQITESDRLYAIDAIKMVYYLPKVPTNRISKYFTPHS